MSNYFLISVPSKGDQPKKIISALDAKIKKIDKETQIAEFDVPFQDLKVGNIDALIYLSDALKKTCVTVEGTIRKVCQLYLELASDDATATEGKKADAKSPPPDAKSDKEKKPPREIEVKGAKPEDALTRFKWDDARYPKRKPLGELSNAIKGSIAEIEKELREKTLEYNSICQKLSQMTANESGNLMTRDINTIIKEYNATHNAHEQFKPVESRLAPETLQMISDFNATSAEKIQPCLTTLYVVVPKNDAKNWKANYESIFIEEEKKEEESHKKEDKPAAGDKDERRFIVPGSSVMLAQDNDSCLFSVVVFTKDIDEFRKLASRRRYNVRRNDPSTVINEEEKANLKKAQEKKKKLLLRWALGSFGDGFNGWLHLKCIQCFVESILRYGLPPECVSMLINPKKGAEKKLVKLLCEHYHHLGGQFNDAEDDAVISTEEKNSGSGDKFFPFIYLEVDLSFVH